MGSLKVYATVAGFLAVATSVTTARAADLLPPPAPLPAVEPIIEPVGGGWYLRGDVGASAYDGGRITNPSFPTTEFTNRHYGSGAFAGGGVGYQFSPWFRADVTGEYRFSTGFGFRDQGDAFTSTVFYNPGSGVYDYYYANGRSYEHTRTDYASAVVLVNGYFDLGTWYGFSPFVGAGIGWAYHMFGNGSTHTVNAYSNYIGPNNVPSPGGPAAGISGGSIKDRNKGDLAWALHAGVAYDVTPNVKLELAYRYLNMGSVTTGAINCFCGSTYAGSKIRDLEAHDVKLGMRWALGGGAAAVAAYEPAPLVRKY